MKLKYKGEVVNGKLELINRKVMIKDLAMYFNNQKISLTIEKWRKTRSQEQNRYYWGVMVEAVKLGLNDVGYKMTTEATHELLKYKFLIKELVNEETGEILNTIGSTTGLSTSEFMEFVAEVQRWAAEYLNINIPNPGEQGNLEFN